MNIGTHHNCASSWGLSSTDRCRASHWNSLGDRHLCCANRHHRERAVNGGDRRAVEPFYVPVPALSNWRNQQSASTCLAIQTTHESCARCLTQAHPSKVLRKPSGTEPSSNTPKQDRSTIDSTMREENSHLYRPKYWTEIRGRGGAR